MSALGLMLSEDILSPWVDGPSKSLTFLNSPEYVRHTNRIFCSQLHFYTLEMICKIHTLLIPHSCTGHSLSLRPNTTTSFVKGKKKDFITKIKSVNQKRPKHSLDPHPTNSLTFWESVKCYQNSLLRVNMFLIE